MRNLEREIANLARKAIKEIVDGDRKHGSRSPGATSRNSPACASSATARPSSRTWSASRTGLAWTEVGGELLSIEAVHAAGQGQA